MNLVLSEGGNKCNQTMDSCRRLSTDLVLTMVDRSDPGTGNVLHPKTTITSVVKTLPVNFNEAVLHQKYAVEKRSLR
jgi:hypothetical protein